MIGLSESLAADLTARGYTDSDVAQLFAPQAWKGEIRVIYRRHPDREDFTSPLPSSRHMDYIAKGWTAVAIEDPPAPIESEPISVPDDIAEHGRNDRAGVWQRGTDEIESSCRHAQSLLSKGWTFAGLADEARRRGRWGGATPRSNANASSKPDA